MRDILTGPFGSMGSMNVKLRNICIEDLILESFFACLSMLRIRIATTVYEFWGACASMLGTSLIAAVTLILVLDGGIQCWCCSKKPILKNVINFSCIDDKSLMLAYLFVSYFGMSMTIMSVVAEVMTIADAREAMRTGFRLPLEIGNVDRVIERDVAIAVIIGQVCVGLPWRVYAVKVIQSVLEAIYCTEVLKFPAQYDEDALAKLLPSVGTPLGVDLAREGDIPVLAVLQYQAFASVLSHIGLPPHRAPALIEAQWRSKGRAVLRWWLGRVGVVRDENGIVVGALSLQLPGDTAAYSLLSHEADESIDSSTTALSASAEAALRFNSGGGSHSWPEHQVGTLERIIGPELMYLGLWNGYRYRYKHAILNDHVCTPGEAYVEFVCTLEGRQGAGTGTRLLRWAHECAEGLGCGRIRLTVMGKSAHLKARYERLGYSDCSSWTDPVALFFMRYVFGIKHDEFFEMEKPLGLHSGLAIYSKPYGFASERLSGSGSFDESEDGMGLSLHDAAVSLLSSTRGALLHARELVSSSEGFTAPEFPRDMNCTRLPLAMDCFDATRHVSVDLDGSSSHPMIPASQEQSSTDSLRSVSAPTASPSSLDWSSISDAIIGNLRVRSSDALKPSDEYSRVKAHPVLTKSLSGAELDGVAVIQETEIAAFPVTATGASQSIPEDAARDISSKSIVRAESISITGSAELEDTRRRRHSYLSTGSIKPAAPPNSEDYDSQSDGIIV